MVKRKNYLIITLVSFGVGFFLYGILAACVRKYTEIPYNGFVTFLIYGFGGGLLIGGVISGIILFANIIKGQKLFIKILACVLFPITMIVICQGGILTFIPYGIYNFVALKKGGIEN